MAPSLSQIKASCAQVRLPKSSRRLVVNVHSAFTLISRPNVGNATLTKPNFRRTAEVRTSVPSLVNASVDKLAAEDGVRRSNFQGVHHVALICRNLENSLEFYQGVLGLQVNPDRPHDKLPYRGAWLWIGSEMIHLMELPNPDPLDNRPEHGGRDRHFCIGIQSIDTLIVKLEAAGINFTKSMSGRPAIFFRDPDMNCLECVELEAWR
eukprot:jgi/Chrzof1/10739/Cz05g10190.t1